MVAANTQQVANKRRLMKNTIILVAILLIIAMGLSMDIGYSPFSSTSTSVQTSVIGAGTPSYEKEVTAMVFASEESGVYPKKSLYVGLEFGGAGEIRYSIDAPPTADSTLYAGRSIDMYSVGTATRKLYAYATDPYGNLSKVSEYTYSFVPDAVTNLTATSQSNGRVDLSWNASSDPDIVRYQVYVDGKEPVSAGLYTVYTVSGLSNQEHTFAVTAVDKYGQESGKVSKTLLLIPVSEEDSIHGSAVEITNDLNSDGVVDAKDVKALLSSIPGGASTEELNALIECWEKEGCGMQTP